MEKDARIYVAGADTAIGAAIVRELKDRDYENIIDPDGIECDLAEFDAVDSLFSESKPEYVFVAAGRSGGIETNRFRPAELMLDNLQVTSNVISAAHEYEVKKLLYLASSCTYPRECAQPMRETDLLSGPPEPTSAAYAAAKRTGIALCQAFCRQYGHSFISAIPANPFGPGDEFSPDASHVIEALIYRMREAEMERAPVVDVWGSGSPTRDFIYVDDLANACLHVMDMYNDPEPINIGTGEAISIRELAFAVKLVTGYSGEIHFDRSRPDGMPKKVLDVTKLTELGWSPLTPFLDALELTYDWYNERFAEAA